VIASRVCEDKASVLFRGLPARQLTRLGLALVDIDNMVIACFVVAMNNTPPCS